MSDGDLSEGERDTDRSEDDLWLKAQESSFAAVWENDEDTVYDMP